MEVSLWVLKESSKSIFNSYNDRNSVLIVSHITLWDCHVYSFSDNLSQNSCKLTIVIEEALICWLVILCNRWCTSFGHFQLDLIAWVTIIRVLNLKVKTKTIPDPFAAWNKLYYYINTNEIPGELSCENLISSHVKISPLLWLHNKSCLSHQKTMKFWFGISFGVYFSTLEEKFCISTRPCNILFLW